MADLSDILIAYATAANAALYPSAPATPTTPSIAGIVCTIGVGWPSPQSLDAILANGSAIVTAFAPPGMERNTTRYPRNEQVGTLNVPTITLTLSGSEITLGGSLAAYAQNLAMTIAEVAYAVQVPANTSLSAAAALLAATYEGATSSGPVVTIPSGVSITNLRTGGYAPTATEVARTEKVFSVIVWAPTPAARDAIAKAIDPVLKQASWLYTPGGSSVRNIYQRTMQIDNDQKQGLFRRDLTYLAEYPTIVTGQAGQIVVFETLQSLVDSAGDVLAGPNAFYA